MNPRMQTLITSMLALPVLSLLALWPAAAQAAWSGWARCELDIRGPGYVNTETHTWFVSGVTPTVVGSGTWTVAGSGQLHQGNPAQTSMDAQWSINAGASANAGGRFRATIANGVVSIKVIHAQLTLPHAISGYVLQTISNSPRTPTTISATAYEWQFPRVEGPATSQTLTGSAPSSPAPGWGIMRASGSTMTASCTWSFADGSTPPPPPPVTAPANPVPPGSQPPPPPQQPPPQQPPADPCSAFLPPYKSPSAARIAGLVPRRFTEGERIIVCGSGLSAAALEDQYADNASGQSLSRPMNAGFVLIGNRSVMALDPVISARGDRIEFTAGGLYERSELTKGIDVLIPVTPVPPRGWSGGFAVRIQGEVEPARGPNVSWRAR